MRPGQIVLAVMPKREYSLTMDRARPASALLLAT
jgi:hypothetical protein